GKNSEYRSTPAIEEGKERHESRGQPSLNVYQFGPGRFCDRDRHQTGDTADEVTEPEAVKGRGPDHLRSDAVARHMPSFTVNRGFPASRSPPGRGEGEGERHRDRDQENSYAKEEEGGHDVVS